MSSYATTPTAWVERRGTRYGYRRFGEGGVPLLLLQHYRGTMDNWDPALLDALARDRTVIAFDNKGVSSSSGITPNTFAAMADDAAELVDALGYESVDLLGFSIGGVVAQELLLRRPKLIRRAILAATAAQGGDGLRTFDPVIAAIATKPIAVLEDLPVLFFEPSMTSQARAHAFIERLRGRTVDMEPAPSEQAWTAQLQAGPAWAAAGDLGFARLSEIKQPVLVANGRHDRMIPTADSVLLFMNLPNAQLMLYPDSGHGFLFEYPELFAEHVATFLR